MRLFGHPLHPLLIAFPIGLLALVPLWDVLSWFTWPGQTAIVAYYSEIAGLIGAALAILTGLVDFAKLRDERAVKIALYHATAVVTSVCFFGVALALRGRSERVSVVVTALDATGAAVLAVAGWFGGHLVFHHGVAVDDTRRD
ncbi:MAG TPA: DUF2231 domain-containing protein [Polyangiaceae bacterium]|jgi:uncharacterized membrane protein